jgi:hypothetical protein
MFTGAFAHQVITAAAQGQPGFVKGPMSFGANLFLSHPAVFNSLFALTQLTIGALILNRRSYKHGLFLSVGWGLIVWVFGEGYGGIFSGHTLLLMGAPGAVIIYVILALAVIPHTKSTETQRKMAAAPWLVLVWAIIWLGGGIYQLLPGQNSTNDVAMMIAGNASGAPGWLVTVDTKSANFVHNLGKTGKLKSPTQIASSMNMTSAQMMHMSSEPYVALPSNPGYWFILVLAAVQFFVGLAALLPRLWRKAGLTVGIILALGFWVIGQSLGGYYTGLATDPNSGPLLILLALVIWGCTDIDRYLARIVKQLEIISVGRADQAYSAKVIKPPVRVK